MRNEAELINCMYCEKEEHLHSIMLEIARLDISTVYLYREQSHPGRCILAMNKHVRKLTDLKDDECAGLFREVLTVANVITRLYEPDKINYLILGDSSPHLHVHLVPKYKNSLAWGAMFEMMPQDPIFLSEDEYIKQIASIKDALQQP